LYQTTQADTYRKCSEMKKADVIVIGAGAIGCAIAYFLGKEGLKTIVVEQDSIGAHASGFAPGILSPLGVALESMEAELPLIARSLKIHKELSQQLPAEAGIDYYFRQSALLKLAFTHTEAQGLNVEVDMLRQQGFNVRWLDGDAVRLIESRISPETIGAAYSEEAAELDSYRYVLALAQAAEKHGAEIRHGQLYGLKRKEGKLTAIQLSSGEIACDCVVLAMGPWTGLASSSLGFPIPIEPQKGQTLRVRASGLPFTTMFAWGSYYNSTTRPDSLIYHGATHEDAGFNEEPTVEGRDELLHSLITMVPSLTEAEVVLQTVCLRPVPADGLPVIGKVPGWDGVYLASGHWTKGILLSPVTALMITQLILTGAASIPTEPFSIARFNSS